MTGSASLRVPISSVATQRILAGQPEKLASGVTSHLAAYATAQSTTPLDDRVIDQIVRAAKKDVCGLRSLVHELVQSELFRRK